MNMQSYSEAMAKLPEHYKSRHYDDVREVKFKGRLIVAHAGEKPLIYENGEWKEFVYENTYIPT